MKFTKLHASLTYALLSVLALSSFSNAIEEIRQLRLTINGQVIERNVEPGKVFAQQISPDTPIKSASVETQDARCFFWRKVRDDASRLNEYKVELSPLFTPDRPISFQGEDSGTRTGTDTGTVGQSWDRCYCYFGDGDGTIAVYLESPEGRFNFYVGTLDERSEIQFVLRSAEVVDTQHAVLLEAQREFISCTVSAFNGPPAKIRVGEPHSEVVARTKYILCQPDESVI